VISGPPETVVPPKSPGVTRFIHLSDTHGHHELFKPCFIDLNADIVLHTGDYCEEEHSNKDLNSFCQFLGSLPVLHKIVISGNHDVSLLMNATTIQERRLKMESVCTFLCDSEITINGLKIYGAPWGRCSPQKWQRIPQDVDILLTHGPSNAHCPYRDCDEFPKLQQRISPLVHCFGHVHKDYGVSGIGGRTVFINSAVVDVNRPVVFDIANI